MADPYTGTATVVVTSGVATITKVSGDGFALLTKGSQVQIGGGFGLVYSNSGTEIVTYAGWGGTSQVSAVAWTGIPPASIQSVTNTTLQILQNLNALNTLPTGRLMAAAAQDTLISIDALLDLYVLGVGTTTPPGSPAEKDAYIVGADATGAWDGQDGKVAYYINGNWTFHTPFNGLRAYNAADASSSTYLGGAWVYGTGGLRPVREVTHSSSEADRTLSLTDSDALILFNTSGGDILFKAPLGLIASGFFLETKILMSVGGGVVDFVTDFSNLTTRFGGLTNVNDDGNGEGGKIVLTASAAKFVGMA